MKVLKMMSFVGCLILVIHVAGVFAAALKARGKFSYIADCGVKSRGDGDHNHDGCDIANNAGYYVGNDHYFHSVVVVVVSTRS